MRNPLHNKWLISGGWVVSSGAALTIMAPKAQGQATLSFNTTNVQAGTNQQLLLEISDPGPEQTIGGQLAVEISAGSITNLDLVTGTIFSSNNTGQQTLFFNGSEQALRAVNTSSGTVTDSGAGDTNALLATITLDTTGLAVGSTFTLQLTQVDGQNTFLNNASDVKISMVGPGYSATATNSPSSPDPVTIHVVAVPEPASGSLLVAGVSGALLRRRRRSA